MEVTRESRDLSVTFPTEVDFETSLNDRNHQLEELRKAAAIDLRLPSSVNFIALRESLLSEAPFVTRSNKAFWRKMIDDFHYQNILAASFRHVLGCISDIGNVNIDKLLDMDNSNSTSTLSVNLAELFFTMKLHDRDLFFAKLPEMTAFMIIEALHTSTPKHYRVYNSIRFREILLDWSSELLSGIRLSHCRTGREWLFTSAQDSNIMTSYNATVRLPSVNATQTAATSLYCIEHSPLIRQYIGLGSNQSPLKGGLGYKVALSHSRDRPLTVMSDYAILRQGKTYNRKCDMQAVRHTLKDALATRKTIMKQSNQLNDSLSADIRKLRESYKISMDHLSNKKVTRAQLVQAMQTNSTSVA